MPVDDVVEGLIVMVEVPAGVCGPDCCCVGGGAALPPPQLAVVKISANTQQAKATGNATCSVAESEASREKYYVE